MKHLIAMQHPDRADTVLLPSGVQLRKKLAIADGYTVIKFGEEPPVQVPTAVNEERSWRSAVMQLPEARSRSSATAELLNSHSPHSLSVASARAFLRGLPPEKPEAKAPIKMTDDPRAAREKEISASMSGFNKSRGYPTDGRKHALQSATNDPVKLKRLAEIRLGALQTRAETAGKGEATNLRYALEVHNRVGTPLAQVFAQLNIDTSKFIAKES